MTGVKSPIEGQIAPGLKKEAKEMKSFFRSPESETMIAEIQRKQNLYSRRIYRCVETDFIMKT